MKRRIIKIDERRCNGCGLCASACHEGAIGMVDGKAKLLREDYCDGLGDCLPACPVNAISFEEREAPAYNEEAAQKARTSNSAAAAGDAPNCLQNFPIQIKLAPVRAPYYAGADLLIAADCTAYAYDNFHRDFIRGRVTLIGCPKLDAVSYADKLGMILQENDIRSVTLVRMTVPCCGGLSYAAQTAIANCGKAIPLNIITVSPDGRIIK